MISGGAWMATISKSSHAGRCRLMATARTSSTRASSSTTSWRAPGRSSSRARAWSSMRPRRAPKAMPAWISTGKVSHFGARAAQARAGQGARKVRSTGAGPNRDVAGASSSEYDSTQIQHSDPTPSQLVSQGCPISPPVMVVSAPPSTNSVIWSLGQGELHREGALVVDLDVRVAGPAAHVVLARAAHRGRAQGDGDVRTRHEAGAAHHHRRRRWRRRCSGRRPPRGAPAARRR